MAKMLKNKSKTKEIDYTRYAEGDQLFDLLRTFYTSTGELHSSKWRALCKADMEHQKKLRKKKINDRRFYGE